MTIRCLAVDDEPLALNKMAGYISKTPFFELAGACRSGYEAIDLLAKTKVDLIFADINMPDINGLDFVKTLHNKPQIIFATAFSEYAIDGFKLDALDYLLKPVGYNEFLKAANKARNYFESVAPDKPKELNPDEYLFVRSDYKTARISVNDIIYIEGMREYVRIHLDSAKPLMPLISLRLLEEQLPSTRFMRVHRSYIVNLQKIVSVEHNRIVFDGKIYIPVSEQYKEVFQSYIKSHLLG
jgi:two-component system, LytTR family, response regulator LytT